MSRQLSLASTNQRRPSRAASFRTMVRSSGSRRDLNSSIHSEISLKEMGIIESTAVWERQTEEDDADFQEYKDMFAQVGTDENGTIGFRALFQIFQESLFPDAPVDPVFVDSVYELIRNFSSSGAALTLSDFTTMMFYVRESMSDEKQSASDQIAAAIEAYKKSVQAIEDRLIERLTPINAIFNMEGVVGTGKIMPNPMDTPFKSHFGPSQMRCLALVSHNGMKDTMMNFVMSNKNVLKKFRLTGTFSTMTMLRNVFKDDSVVFGPTCKSGPLGGDAQLVAHMADGRIGGIIFFEDPLKSHAHAGDIDSLNRAVKMHNIMSASNAASAMMLMNTLKYGLENGAPEVFPSFFKTLSASTVDNYSTEQQAFVKNSNGANNNETTKTTVDLDESSETDSSLDSPINMNVVMPSNIMASVEQGEDLEEKKSEEEPMHRYKEVQVMESACSRSIDSIDEA